MNDWNQSIIDEFRANEGRVGGQFEGAPMIIIHTTGAKSGELREHPLVFHDIDDRRFIIASAAGSDRHPAWFHNLRAQPDISVEVGTETYDATATVVPTEERDRLFEVVKQRMPGFADYEKKTDRVIPIVELTRR